VKALLLAALLSCLPSAKDVWFDGGQDGDTFYFRIRCGDGRIVLKIPFLNETEARKYHHANYKSLAEEYKYACPCEEK
jgi:hypothetical protein